MPMDDLIKFNFVGKVWKAGNSVLVVTIPKLIVDIGEIEKGNTLDIRISKVYRGEYKNGKKIKINKNNCR